VTPDKRKIFLHQESKLISFLKTAFSSHFEKALLAFGSQEFNPMMGLLESDSSTSDSQYSSSSGTPPVPRKRKKRTNSGSLVS